METGYRIYGSAFHIACNYDRNDYGIYSKGKCGSFSGNRVAFDVPWNVKLCFAEKNHRK